MALQARHAFPVLPRPASGQIQPRQAFSPEIAFLVDLVDRKALIAAEQAARRERVCAARALIAYGYIDASFYYQALARHLRLAFCDDWPEIELGVDIGEALAMGCLPLTGRPLRWLIAPQEGQLRALLTGRLTYFDPTQVMITTPAHLAALVQHDAQASIETIATHRLPTSMPRYSARGAVDARIWFALALFAAVCIAVGLVFTPRAVAIVFGLLFLVGMMFRFAVSAEALAPPDQAPPALTDDELPTYTILLPLHKEAEVVPDILDALAAIDYPRAKLDVLILVEPEDGATRAALAAVDLPPWMRIVVAPRLGDLRTKPRALNIGLLMADGDLLTVYDAEDRPDPDQLRRAAAMFKANRDLSCLQARLAIDNGDRSILARMFAIEYAALFDVLNVGIARLGLPMALGGTSNHFRSIR